MFLDILELRIEKETKKQIGTTVLKMWSQICEKKTSFCVNKSAFRKKFKN